MKTNTPYWTERFQNLNRDSELDISHLLWSDILYQVFIRLAIKNTGEASRRQQGLEYRNEMAKRQQKQINKNKSNSKAAAVVTIPCQMIASDNPDRNRSKAVSVAALIINLITKYNKPNQNKRLSFIHRFS
jgi:hypothetical protein